MAREVRHFTATINPGSTAAAPQLVNLSMPPRIVRRVTIRVPPGPRGRVGFKLGSGGQAFIPYNDAYIVADDATMPFDLTDAIESGAWQLIAYNTGTYAHDLALTFELDLTQDAAPDVFSGQFIPADQLTN